MREVTLPSGSTLKITPAPFPEARALYQAVVEEMKGLKLDPEAEIDVNFYKDVFCVGLSSKKIEAALWKCMERSLINDLKITADTFEPVEKRDDYLTVCFEVAQENIRPFTKSLFAQYGHIFAMIQSGQASRQATTQS